ncbi:MAG TPA: serine hydrolase [Pseudonocardiaceae bacterium]|jgi:CubicO group peptidase (beta-lactamase class C family)|nr:serine hydrolase [Pseudonocardiaceae bacterium]
MSIRSVAITSAILVAAVSVTSPAASAGQNWQQGRFDQPQQGYAPAWTTLRNGTPQEAGLDPGPIDAALAQVNGWTQNDPTTGHPMYSGQVTLLAHDGVVVAKDASGDALRYADQQGDPLPAAQQIPMRTNTIFDLASLSKLFTCIVAMQQIQAGRLDVNATVASYLPQFATNGKGSITIEQLMTHTSGLPADPTPALWQYPDMPSRIDAILDVAPQFAPGSTYLYSDMNMMTLQLVLRQITGQTLDVLVRNGITKPLGMRDTMYNPPASLRPRIAAEEYEVGPGEPQRGLVWGQVHDENAWALGGVAGHAGVFSTVDDIAVLAQAILNGGTYAGHRILSEQSVTQMLTNYNQAFPGDSHGLGFELDQRWYMGRLDSTRTAGHTGFTGTTIVIDPVSRSIALQFSNRVHPTRNWGSTNPARRAVADGLANAMAVRAPNGQSSWYSGISDATTATLTTPVITTRGTPVTVSYDTFVDTEPSFDLVTLQSSPDGVTWTNVPVTATGTGAPVGQVSTLSGGSRAWWRVSARLPASSGPLYVRWRYVTDPAYTGRGVNVAGVRVADQQGTLFDGDRNQHAFTDVNWVLTNH